MGESALMVCTNDTGMTEVALWLVIWPTNWKRPMGNVVEIINALGVMKFLTEWLSECKSGTEPFGNRNASVGSTVKATKSVTHINAFKMNWNWVSVTGYWKRDKMALVELDDTIEKPYHNAHIDTTSKLTLGSAFRSHESDTGSSGTEANVSRLTVEPALDPREKK